MSRAGVNLRHGVVLAIDGTTIQMMDVKTSSPYEVPLSAPAGVLPVVGDQWMCTTEYGNWALDYCLTPRSTRYAPHTTFRQVLASITDRGLADPSFADSNTMPEAPHLAYISEIRWFVGTPDSFYWLRADGSTVDRVDYRELGAVLDPDGDDTFILPLVSSVGTAGGGRPLALSYICAR